MKKTRLLTLIMAVLLMICMIPASAFAAAPYSYDATITDFNQLGSGTLLADYDQILLTGNIETNDLSTFATLLKGSGKFMPTIQASLSFASND